MYQQGATVPHIAGDCAFNLSGSAGGTPGVSFYAKPGTQSIANIVTNLGTFVETGLTCYAEIWEYISSENGTLVYNDDVAAITLNPLGDEETLTFDSYNFALEGIYALKFNFPLANDDVEANNMKTLGIGIDSTAPVSTGQSPQQHQMVRTAGIRVMSPSPSQQPIQKVMMSLLVSKRSSTKSMVAPGRPTQRHSK
jgi:hypothetical protein